MPCKDPLFSLWWNIKNRCFNPAVRNFKYYGGRKITGPWMYESWIRGFAAFRAYLLDTIGPARSTRSTARKMISATSLVTCAGLCLSSRTTTTELGLKYGLHRNTVNRVIQRASHGGWAHVA